MLRALVLLLVLLNAALFAWREGWLQGPLGLTAQAEREPARLAQQVRPDSITIRPLAGASAPASGPTSASAPAAERPASPADEAASAGVPASAVAEAAPASGPAAIASGTSTSASTPAAASAAAPAASLIATAPEFLCLQAGPFAPGAVAAAEQAVTALPAGSWRRVSVGGGGAFFVYVGKFADRASLQRQLDELTTLRIPAEEVRGLPALEPGLILSRHDSRERADAALDDVLQRGARTARVVPSGNGPAAVVLRIERADAALVRRATGLKSPSLGAGFQPCPRPVG